MKLPKEIKVGGHIFKVVYPYKFRERTDYMGQADLVLCEIRISDIDGSGNKRSESCITQSFIHELLHCVNYVYNANKLDEDTIKCISQGLFQVCNDNLFNE